MSIVCTMFLCLYRQQDLNAVLETLMSGLKITSPYVVLYILYLQYVSIQVLYARFCAEVFYLSRTLYVSLAFYLFNNS